MWASAVLAPEGEIFHKMNVLNIVDWLDMGVETVQKPLVRRDGCALRRGRYGQTCFLPCGFPLECTLLPSVSRRGYVRGLFSREEQRAPRVPRLGR